MICSDLQTPAHPAGSRTVVVWSGPPDLAMLDLVKGNLDGVIVDTPVAANYALRPDRFKGMPKIAREIVTKEVYGLTVQKGDPKGLLSIFITGLKNVKASSEYDKIREKWIAITAK